MKPACNVATLIERFFTERLIRQRNVSANTIASYRDTFRLLFMFAQVRLRKSPSALTPIWMQRSSARSSPISR
jgi:integrase/recombinase XerD